LPTTELVRVEGCALTPQPYQFQDFCHTLTDDSPAQAIFWRQGLGDDVLYTHARIQRAIWVLEHGLHRAAIAGQIMSTKRSHFLAIEEQ
jgi:hypothetical protein